MAPETTFLRNDGTELATIENVDPYEHEVSTADRVFVVTFAESVSARERQLFDEYLADCFEDAARAVADCVEQGIRGVGR